jgi:hypothetical protein
MNKIKYLCLIFFSGLIACNNPKTDAEKLIPKKEINTLQVNHNKVLKYETFTPSDSTISTSNKVLLVSKQTKRKSTPKSEVVDFLIEADSRPEQNNIIPGFVRNSFHKIGNNYYFNRKVKQDEDSRIGCSSGGNELSFTVINPKDTFLIENESLKDLNFKYQIIGGIYSEEGVFAHKGKVKGMLLPDHNWQIEINVWIKMKDMQLNKEIERQIIINDKFIM